jgi:hypothetical protein
MEKESATRPAAATCATVTIGNLRRRDTLGILHLRIGVSLYPGSRYILPTAHAHILGSRRVG